MWWVVEVKIPREGWVNCYFPEENFRFRTRDEAIDAANSSRDAQTKYKCYLNGKALPIPNYKQRIRKLDGAP